MLRRSFFRFPPLAGLVALLVLLSVAVADTVTAPSGAVAGAESWELTAERDLFARHNAHRAANGLEPLVRDPALDAVAREWTAQMAGDEVLRHRTNLREAVESSVTTQWQRIGENVGWGPSSEWLHNAFVASSGHNANILGDYNRVGIGATRDDDGDLWVTVNFLDGPDINPTPDLPDAAPVDGWVVDDTGMVGTLGDAPFFGDLAAVTLSDPIVAMTGTPTGNGYWLVAADGGIFAFGDAGFFGSTGAMTLNSPIVDMAATPSGKGYWLVAADGGIFAFGDARFFGSTGAIRLNSPIVGMTSTPTGNGYWLVAADGGIFAFGDAAFRGSTGAIALNQPIAGMAATSTGNGYWLVAADGGIFAFGDATYQGALPALGVGLDAVAIGARSDQAVPAGDGTTYWVFDTTGLAVAFGGAVDGLAGSATLAGPVVGSALR